MRARTTWLLTALLALGVFAVCGVAAPPAEPAKAPPAEPAKTPPAVAEINAKFAAFLKEPTKENFLAVRQLVVASPAYQPYSDDLGDIDDLLGEKKYAEAEARFKAALPNLLLSPRAHRFAAQAAKARGDEAAASDEAAAAEKCLKGILDTGDGSEKAPYLVVRVSDEYDLLRHLEKRSHGQGLRWKDKQICDVLRITGGGELWFDISDVLQKKLGTLKPKKEK